MFLLLREWFARPDAPHRGRRHRRGRAWRILALFAFEFTVVLLGVLAAQQLQAYFLDRREREAAQVAVDEHIADLKDFAEFAAYQKLSNRCAREYLEVIQRVAASGERPEDFAFRPVFDPAVWVTEWDNATRRTVERYHGYEIVLQHSRLEKSSARIIEGKHRAMSDWGIISLVTLDGFDDNPDLQSEIQTATGRLYAQKVEMMQIAQGVSTYLADKDVAFDEDRGRGAAANIPGCDLAADDSAAQSG